ncbi:MAG: hypothetical protein J6L69_01410 [Lachnospiraceae bacterium]|nr:hypothetical protein [Lachnospiraceae bacterium]
MKKNLKKVLLLFLTVILTLSFVACASDDDDDDDDKDDDKKTESRYDADKKPSVEIPDGKEEAEDVIEDFLMAYEEFDLKEMNKCVFVDLEDLDKNTMEMFEEFEDGKVSYDEGGFKCDMVLKIDTDMDDVEEIDVDDLKDIMKKSDVYDEIDFDEVSEAYECSATLKMKMLYENMKIDYDEMGVTEAELAQVEAEIGMSLEDYMKQYLDETFKKFTDEKDVTLYAAEYEGEWKIIYLKDVE